MHGEYMLMYVTTMLVGFSSFFTVDLWKSGIETIIIALIFSLVGCGVPNPTNRFSVFSNVAAAVGIALLVHIVLYPRHNLDKTWEFLLAAAAGFGGAPLFVQVRKGLYSINVRNILSIVFKIEDKK
jgi:branched-subunit amino acid transport protein